MVKSSGGKLYGMGSLGGTENEGTVFSFDPIARTFEKLYDFNDSVQHSGKVPLGSLVETPGYWFFGTASAGGTENKGVIFRFNIITHQYSPVYDLSGSDGSNPTGDLLPASDGKLYGLTAFGGINNEGTLFRINPLTLSFNKLADFDSIAGKTPAGSLVQTDDHLLYGITTDGGSGYGTIFSCDPDSSKLQTVFTFDGSTVGSNPRSGMIKAADGKLYGMTETGGSHNMGVIYVFDPVSQQCTKLVDFNGDNGAYPQGSLMEAPNGWLYGMTTQGGDDNMV
jgi:uncharacterized repeat protein (TIGR03803 family)